MGGMKDADGLWHLMLTYKYSVRRIRQFMPVQMGVEIKEADIIVHADDSASRSANPGINTAL